MLSVSTASPEAMSELVVSERVVDDSDKRKLSTASVGLHLELCNSCNSIFA